LRKHCRMTKSFLFLKIAVNVIPDTGESHIDQATKGVAKKFLG
jgi:hypothetical protein